MTPYEIELLLRFHYRGARALEGMRDAPILRPTLEDLAHQQLIERGLPFDEPNWSPLTASMTQLEQFYSCGPALATYVKAICAVPAPQLVQRWEIPKEPA